jgi:Leucine-rich repeat (LRR) protein
MKKICTLSILLIISASIKIKAQVNVNDSLAVVDLYNSTNGDHWNSKNNWLTKKPLGTWYGIEVRKNRVFKIYLPINNLTGTIPASIGNLTELRHLVLSESPFLKGPIPSTIGNLRQLQTLVLTELGLTGTIPDEITKLVNLRKLSLQNNYTLTGNIPFNIGNLINLRALTLYANNLSGTLPSSIGNCTNLILIDLHENKLTGPLPSSIGSMISLKELRAEDNQLSGEIPDSIGNLINLESILLEDNQLTGNIPSTLSKLINLNTLDLYHNLLSGQIPPSLGNLKNLTYLSLANNKLRGNIPSTLGSLNSDLYLDHNNLSGPVPSTFTNLPQYISLYLDYNQFTFDGIEAIAEKYDYDSIADNVEYAPQARRTIHQTGNSLSIYAGGTLSNNTYTWLKVGATKANVIVGDSVFHPTSDGSYYVNVTNALAKDLTIKSDTIVYTASLPSGDITNANSKTKSNNILVSVFPNPATSVLNINVQSATAANAFIQITDVHGKTLLQTERIISSGFNTFPFDVSRFAKGMYILKIVQNNNALNLEWLKQ